MKSARSRGIVFALGALLVPLAVEAQDPPPAAPAGDIELASFREVFAYPAFTRRNPFRAVGSGGGGVRFEQLSLIGIMYSGDPSASVAVLSTGGVSIAPDGTASPVAGDAFNAKAGQRIGNTTIREIQRDRVIVDVEEFGLIDRRTMTFVSRRQGGSE